MIPKRFKLMGHTIEVVIDNEYGEQNNCKGRFIEWENKIILSVKYKTNKTWRKYKDEIIESSFKHELVHAILYYMGEEKLWLNEKFVESLSGLLYQAEITAE